MEEKLSALIAALKEERDRSRVRAWRERVEALPPSPLRERALAWLFLVEAEGLLASGRIREALGPMTTAYSYARTARDVEAFRRARLGVARLRDAWNPGTPRRKRRRR